MGPILEQAVPFESLCNGGRLKRVVGSWVVDGRSGRGLKVRKKRSEVDFTGSVNTKTTFARHIFCAQRKLETK